MRREVGGLQSSAGEPPADGSSELWDRCAQSVGGGVSSGLRRTIMPWPLFVERGQGCRVWDVDGREYIDYVMGWGPLILGHSHPELIHAVRDQLELGSLYGTGHRLEYTAAEMVIESVPGLQRILWSNTGTEAVHVAMRLARAHTGRTKIIKFVGGYHGWTDSVLASYSSHTAGTAATSNSKGQSVAAQQDLIVLPFGDVSSVTEVLSHAAAEGVAGVLIDPIMSNYGLIEPPAGYLEAVRSACTANNVVLIFDDVIAGFRIALGGSTERFGVVPDLVVFAKAIAGGFSQSAVGGSAQLIDQVLDGVVHAGTYNGNPIALAAVRATLTQLRQPGRYAALEDTAQSLADGLNAIFSELRAPLHAHHLGPIVQMMPIAAGQEVAFGPGIDWSYWDMLTNACRQRGLFLLPRGRLFLSTVHGADDIAETIAAFRDAVRQLR